MEGPPLRAIAERLSFLEKLGIGAVSGNTKAGKERLQGQKVSRIYTVGKRLVIETDSMAILIHFLMFGSYRLNERREGMEPRLSLSLGDNELNFYNCSVKIVTSQEPTDLDPNSDILNPDFAKSRAIEGMRGYEGVSLIYYWIRPSLPVWATLSRMKPCLRRESTLPAPQKASRRNRRKDSLKRPYGFPTSSWRSKEAAKNSSRF